MKLRNIASSAGESLEIVRDLAENGVNAPRRVFAGARALLPWPPPPGRRLEVRVFQPWNSSWSDSFQQEDPVNPRDWLRGG